MANKLTITYGNEVLVNAQEISGDAAVTYGGSTIATVSAGGTKTLNCNEKYMSTNVGVATKTLNCANQIMSGDIGVTVESGVTNITITITGEGTAFKCYVSIDEKKYYSPTTVISTLDTVISFLLTGGMFSNQVLYINGTSVKSGTFQIEGNVWLKSNCDIKFNYKEGRKNSIEITGDAELVG